MPTDNNLEDRIEETDSRREEFNVQLKASGSPGLISQFLECLTPRGNTKSDLFENIRIVHFEQLNTPWC